MKRLAFLAAVTFAVGLLLAGALRYRAAHPQVEATAVPSYPRFDLEAEVTATGLEPPRLRVPKNHEVHLLVRGAPDAPEGRLSILGYETLTEPVYLGPGQSREIVFQSVRPGDDFAFALGEEVVGRLEVTGDHLEEGHR